MATMRRLRACQVGVRNSLALGAATRAYPTPHLHFGRHDTVSPSLHTMSTTTALDPNVVQQMIETSFKSQSTGNIVRNP